MEINIEKIKKDKPIEELLRFSIINIDKPSGPTSFSVSNYIMKKLNVNKTSHLGTLDPMVSGVLPILVGRACRLNEYLMHSDKEYVGIMRLHKDISETELKKIIDKFIGKISQLPPKKSRVKRAHREREIKTFDILEKDGKDFLFKTRVQAGTYIRKLIHDIGEHLDGAHMLELRRIKSSIFTESKIIDLYEFDKIIDEYKKGNEKPLREILIPAEIISQVLPVIQIKKENLKQLLTGKPLMKKDVKEKIDSDNFVLFNGNSFVGVYVKSDEGDIIARPKYVFN